MNSIILIGGPPGAGKTTLARAMAAHLGRKTITMDDLIVAARSVTNPETHPWLHQSGGQGHLSYFTDTAPEKLIADSAELAEGSWAIVERVVRHHRASDTELVMDWWLFEPAKVASFEPTVAVVWLYIDPAALEIRERANDWREGSADPEGMHRNFMERSWWRNAYLAEKAEALGQPVLRLTGAETAEEMLAAAINVMS